MAKDSELAFYEGLGYEFNINARGYKVWKRGVYIGGAGIMPGKKLHPKHAQANVKMFRKHALELARQHERELVGSV